MPDRRHDLPDVRGLYRFYEELALRFAERGYRAVAIDYFGRTAGVEKRGDDFEYMPHVEQTTPGGVRRTPRRRSRTYARRARERLHVGFWFGGRNRGSPRRATTGSRELSASTAGPAQDATGRRARSSARGRSPLRSSG